MKIENIITFLESKKEELKNDTSLEYLLELETDFIIIRSELLKLQELHSTEATTDSIAFANNLTISLNDMVHKEIICCLEEELKNINSESKPLKKEMKTRLKDQLTEALELRVFMEKLLISNKM